MDVRDVAPVPAAAAWPRALDHAPPQRRHEMEVSLTLLIERAGASSPVRGTLGRREFASLCAGIDGRTAPLFAPLWHVLRFGGGGGGIAGAAPRSARRSQARPF